MFNIKAWAIKIIDPMHPEMIPTQLDARYRADVAVAKTLVPILLRFADPETNWPSRDARLGKKVELAKQHNGSDCGVYVCKYIDANLRGLNPTAAKWTVEDSLLASCLGTAQRNGMGPPRGYKMAGSLMLDSDED